MSAKNRMIREIQRRAGRQSIAVVEVRHPGHVILQATQGDKTVQLSMSSSPKDEEVTVRNVLADIRRLLSAAP